MVPSSEEDISLLVGLGFTIEQASAALQVCNGNVEAAANFLFSGGASDESGVTTAIHANSDSARVPSSPVRMIQASVSQYSIRDGRSACTCMALQAAQEFLATPDLTIDETFLTNALLSGASIYQQQFSSNRNGVEHLSAEEVLGAYSGLTNHSGILQGMLSSNRNDSRGFHQTLFQVQKSSPHRVCCTITKPPETVLVCLPPTGHSKDYILIDTHPRPHQFGADQAYARIHSSLDDLVDSLEILFPATSLGPDIPELMAAMYNSFDVCILKRAGS